MVTNKLINSMHNLPPPPQTKTQQTNKQTKKLEASEKLCQKLFQSGQYWQKKCEKKDKELHQIMSMYNLGDDLLLDFFNFEKKNQFETYIIFLKNKNENEM